MTLRHHPRDDVLIHSLHDARTGSFQYVVADPATRMAAIIDPVLDFDEASGSVSTANADALIAHVQREGLTVAWILDTHPHADHVSAAAYLKDALGAPMAIGAHVTGVQALWQEIYGLDDLATDGRQWDRLLADGDTFAIGTLTVRVLFSPGHTLASVSYLVGSNAFVHDTLMMPDSGTSRADFPGADPHQLYATLQRILALPGDTALFVGHDYGRDGRAPACMSTVDAQRAHNIHLAGDVTEADFVRTRQARDATLPLPKLMLHALQFNIRGGRLPEPDDRGRRFLRIPLGRFTPPAG